MQGRTLLLFASLISALIATPVPMPTLDRFETSLVEPRNSLSISSVIRSIIPHGSLALVASRKSAPTTEGLFDDAESDAGYRKVANEELNARGFVPKKTGGSKRGWVPKKGGSKRGYVPKQGGSKRGYIPKKGGSKRGFVLSPEA
ncbi:hypothetical protein EKO04_001536 [Ascochyta lentis]|uniref:Uncharacterized protein n=1 Tax=Ascochyta lentis TaxID=205686 RepID=A0A8H7JC16_9PLEO|nr:hypothetical protein EKO04_001536 [Ascochyta lentis]